MTAVEVEARSIFLSAMDREPGEWPAFLEESCAGNAELRANVEQLLRAHEAMGSIHGGGQRSPVTIDQHAVVELAGTVIGPYKLIEQIGEGGMGTVWMAQQSEPVKRLVAVKLIKAGMDSRQVIARFEAERQALALMDHTNIARVLDGGTTSAGRPYFVMDLVRGVPITRYCDEHHLTPRQRLELFIPVCQALQHAHQKGIIHRDLKPTNVLVALYDGKPVPKVIDFGVAKATGQALTDKTLVTGFGNIVGTLEYMAPEQAEINQLDIDTRSDIYSLGVLLYELLAGSPPFSRQELEKAGMVEMLRVIREEEPSKPSTKLSTADGLPTLAANRGTEPSKLTRLVRGELDWIVMKALEKDRNRRYETANGFAADVQRYLADEPVQACPPSAGYRLGKFARRNTRGLTVAALVLFFLVLLGSGVGWTVRDRAARAAAQATHLERAVERAELLQREGKRGEALAALERARLLAREAEPSPPMTERMASLLQLLDAEGRDEVFVARFEAIRREVQTEVDVETSRFRVRETYPKWREALEHYGIAVGVTPPAAVVTHIQKRPAAIQTILIAALDECRFENDPRRREWLIDVLRQADNDPWRNQVRRAWKEPATLKALARDIDVRLQPPSFLLLLADALPIESPSRLDLEQRVQFAYPGDFWANHQLAFDLDRAGKHAAAIRYFTAALSLRPDNPGVLLNRANPLQEVGEPEAAIADLQRAITVAPRYAMAYNNLGIFLQDQKKLDEAIDAYQKAIKVDPQFVFAYIHLGAALIDQQKLPEAIVAFRKAIELDPKEAKAYNGLGSVFIDQQKLPQAIEVLEKAIELDPKSSEAHNRIGIVMARLKNLPKAIAAFRKAIELNPKNAMAYNNLAGAFADQKQPAEAIDAYRKAIEIDPKHPLAHTNLARTLRDQGKLDEAIDAFQKAIQVNPKDASAHDGLGSLFIDLQKWPEAIDAHRKVIAINPKYPHAYYSLGLALYLHGELKDAIDAYHQAIAIDPKNAMAHCNLGLALLKLGKLDEAVAACRKALQVDPKLANSHNILGLCLMERGKVDEAITSYHQAIEIDRGFVDAHSNLGAALRRQGRFEEAIAAFRKTIDLDSKQVFARREWALLLITCPDPKFRDPRLAVELAKQMVELEPQSSEAWQVLGWVQYRAGAWRESIEALDKSCKLQPGGTGDAGQWIVLAMAHAKLEAQEGLPEKERENHHAEGGRWYEQADKQIDNWWRVRPGHDAGQAIWDFREEARELMVAKANNK